MPRTLFAFVTIIALALTACGPATPPTAPPEVSEPGVPFFPPPELVDIDEAALSAIDIMAEPVLPEAPYWLPYFYAQGQATVGRNPRVFSTLGDCMTETEYFMVPFATGDYDLGEYGDLQSVIDYFGSTPSRQGDDWDKTSFSDHGIATARGFNIAGPLDATWADPNWCEAGETPLDCEYRVLNSSFAVIMYGTNDVLYVEPKLYNYHLRTLVSETLSAGVFPILSTFPTHPVDPDRSALLNRIVIQVARDYDLPLINLNRALAGLPNGGVPEDDPLTMSKPPDGGVAVFTDANLQYGATVRNLVTLQTLDVMLRAIDAY